MTVAATYDSRPPIGSPSIRITLSPRPVSGTHIAIPKNRLSSSNEKHHMRPYLAFGTPPGTLFVVYVGKVSRC